jgi:hypothetical protein
MTCDQAQELILLSDTPETAAVGRPELAAHLLACPACEATITRLTRIEAAASQLPLPANADDARRAVLANLRRQRQQPRLILRPAWLGAVAAMLVVGLGLFALLRPAPASASVVEQLIDWDVALADAQGPQEREQLYTSSADQLQSAVRTAKLTDEDRRLATSLLESGASLRRTSDPVERTERFCDLADLLVGRMNSAAAADDEPTVQRLGKHYGRLQRGIGLSLDQLDANAYIAPERGASKAERLERIAKRREDAQRRLQLMADRSPKNAQRALHRALENVRQRQAAKRAVTTAPN